MLNEDMAESCRLMELEDQNSPLTPSIQDDTELLAEKECYKKHHRLLRLDRPQLYIQCPLAVQPTTRMGDILFTQYIHENLRGMGITEIFRLQTYSWPLILARDSVMMINTPKSGKTMAYLPALCSVVTSEVDKTESRGLSPEVLILAPTITAVEDIFARIRRIDTDRQLRVIKVFQSSPQTIAALSNGWDIIIAVPRIFLKLLSLENVVSLDKMDILVLDNIGSYLNEMVSILKYCHKRILDQSVQIIIVEEQWSKFTHYFLENYRMSLLIGAHLESAVYAGVIFRFQILKEKMKPFLISNILQKQEHQKVVIICEDQKQIQALSNQLKLMSITHLYAHENTRGEEIEDIYLEWNNDKSNSCLVLVCSDSVLYDLDINDATVVIHYALPSTWSAFTYRFSCMLTHYGPQNDSDNRVKCYSYILIDELNVRQLPRIKSFVERMGKDVGEQITAVVEDENLCREREKGENGVVLCDSLLMLGNCININTCSKRHLVIPSDRPAKHLPMSGQIKFKLSEVVDVDHYIARIAEFKLDLDKEEWTESPYSKCFTSIGCTFYYNNFDTEVTSVPSKIGYLCAINLEEKVFERCKIVNIIEPAKGSVNILVDIDLIDIGKIKKNVPLTLLLELPEHLKSDPPNVTHIRISGIKPYCDHYWSSSALHLIKNVAKKPIVRQETFTAGILFILGDTIWVDDIRIMRSRETKELCMKSMLSVILENNIGIHFDGHIEKMKKLCGKTLFQMSEIEDNDSNIYEEGIELQDPSAEKKVDDLKKHVVNVEDTEHSAKIKESLLADLLEKRRRLHQPRVIPQAKLLSKGETYDTILVVAENPFLFYLHLNSDLDDLNKFVKNIQDYMTHPRNRIKIRPGSGEFCLALSGDETYGRAKILKIPAHAEDSYLVQFVDFGDVCNVSTVYYIDSSFLSFPRQAIKCSLHRVSVPEEKIDQAMQPFFRNFCTWSTQVIDIIHNDEPVDSGVYYEVNITIPNKGEELNLNEEVSKKASLECIGPSINKSEYSSIPTAVMPIVENMHVYNEDRELEEDVEGFEVVNLRSFIQDQFINKERMVLPSPPKIMFPKIASPKIAVPKIEEVDSSSELLPCSNNEQNEQQQNRDEMNISAYDGDVWSFSTSNADCFLKNGLPSLVSISNVPNITWSQDEKYIRIKIMLPNIKDYELKISVNNIYFGTINENNIKYEFSLKFFGGVKPGLTMHKKCGTYVYVRCVKLLNRPWLSLQIEDKKPRWISRESWAEFEGPILTEADGDDNSKNYSKEDLTFEDEYDMNTDDSDFEEEQSVDIH